MSEQSLAWVKPYYTKAGDYWGPLGLDDSYLKRLEAVSRLCGASPKRILELGAGCGETAAIMANAGHDVVAVEFSPTRAPHIRYLAGRVMEGKLTAYEDDFYDVDLQTGFDVICYWDGFGVGSDNDQRRLLSRMSREWLRPDGCVLLDVFNPVRWILETGKEWTLDRNHSSHRYRQRRRFDFDPINGSFVDQWCPINDESGICDESMAITQVIRCYNPSDLRLLLEGTGLKIDSIEVDGSRLDLTATSHSDCPIWSAWSYLVKLVPETVS